MSKYGYIEVFQSNVIRDNEWTVVLSISWKTTFQDFDKKKKKQTSELSSKMAIKTIYGKTFKGLLVWNHCANLAKISCEASLGNIIQLCEYYWDGRLDKIW